MFSIRFQRDVAITHHARLRMAERRISDAMLLEVIDRGEIRYRDANHLWAFKAFPDRNDNLMCAVLILEDVIVVKTVMHNFSIMERQ